MLFKYNKDNLKVWAIFQAMLPSRIEHPYFRCCGLNEQHRCAEKGFKEITPLPSADIINKRTPLCWEKAPAERRQHRQLGRGAESTWHRSSWGSGSDLGGCSIPRSPQPRSPQDKHGAEQQAEGQAHPLQLLSESLGRMQGCRAAAVCPLVWRAEVFFSLLFLWCVLSRDRRCSVLSRVCFRGREWRGEVVCKVPAYRQGRETCCIAQPGKLCTTKSGKLHFSLICLSLGVVSSKFTPNQRFVGNLSPWTPRFIVVLESVPKAAFLV